MPGDPDVADLRDSLQGQLESTRSLLEKSRRYLAELYEHCARLAQPRSGSKQPGSRPR